jgi:tartronate-semialdehyde synthase
MAKMTTAEAAVRVLESEGVGLVFGQPGAAILPLYQSMMLFSVPLS